MSGREIAPTKLRTRKTRSSVRIRDRRSETGQQNGLSATTGPFSWRGLPPSPDYTPEPSSSSSDGLPLQRRGRVSSTPETTAVGSETTTSTRLETYRKEPTHPMDQVSVDVAKLVLRLQEHYSLGQNELSAKAEAASAQQQEALAHLCNMASELNEVRAETKELETRLDSQLGLFQHIADFMNQVAQGRFCHGTNESLVTPGEPSFSPSGSPAAANTPAVNSSQLYRSDKINRAVHNSTQEYQNLILEDLPPTPSFCTPLRSTGVKATKRKTRNNPAISSRATANAKMMKRKKNTVQEANLPDEGSLFVTDDEYDKDQYSSEDEPTLMDIIRSARKRPRVEPAPASPGTALVNPFQTGLNLNFENRPSLQEPYFSSNLALPPLEAVAPPRAFGPPGPEPVEPHFFSLPRQQAPVAEMGEASLLSLAGYHTGRVSPLMFTSSTPQATVAHAYGEQNVAVGQAGPNIPPPSTATRAPVAPSNEPATPTFRGSQPESVGPPMFTFSTRRAPVAQAYKQQNARVAQVEPVIPQAFTFSTRRAPVAQTQEQQNPPASQVKPALPQAFTFSTRSSAPRSGNSSVPSQLEPQDSGVAPVEPTNAQGSASGTQRNTATQTQESASGGPQVSLEVSNARVDSPRVPGNHSVGGWSGPNQVVTSPTNTAPVPASDAAAAPIAAEGTHRESSRRRPFTSQAFVLRAHRESAWSADRYSDSSVSPELARSSGWTAINAANNASTDNNNLAHAVQALKRLRESQGHARSSSTASNADLEPASNPAIQPTPSHVAEPVSSQAAEPASSQAAEPTRRSTRSLRSRTARVQYAAPLAGADAFEDDSDDSDDSDDEDIPARVPTRMPTRMPKRPPARIDDDDDGDLYQPDDETEDEEDSEATEDEEQVITSNNTQPANDVQSSNIAQSANNVQAATVTQFANTPAANGTYKPRYSASRSTDTLVYQLPDGTSFTFSYAPSTVRETWDQWTVGANGNEAIGELERRYGTGWRTSRDPDQKVRAKAIKYASNYVVTRRIIVRYVELESAKRGMTAHALCDLLDRVVQGRLTLVKEYLSHQKDPFTIPPKK